MDTTITPRRAIIAVAIVIIILIIVIVWQRYAARRASTEILAQFACGFWRASAADCDAGGYTSAYLYIARPDEGLCANGYIVAVGDSASDGLNSAVDIEFIAANRANITINGEVTRAMIACDFVLGEMRWLDEDGIALFAWEKNSDITRAVVPVAHRAQDDTSSIAI